MGGTGVWGVEWQGQRSGVHGLMWEHSLLYPSLSFLATLRTAPFPCIGSVVTASGHVLKWAG